MEKKQRPNDITVEIRGLLKDLHSLADEVSLLEERITKMAVKSQPKKCPAGIKDLNRPELSTVICGSSNIIPFPTASLFINPDRQSCSKQFSASAPFLAIPGNPLPGGIPDYRPVLQRDGLILLAWDKRVTETGDRYTAYWITSTGIPRFYASKQLLQCDFPFARPDHKSYAAEDGIDFYGQKAPSFMVHVAPELMKSNPQHKELREAHINSLRNLGIKVNFNHKYLLKLEKSRKTESKKSGPQNQAG